MSTPDQRAAQLAEMRVWAEARDRRAGDAAHLPGGTADCFARVGYWDDQVAEYETRWSRADREWRDVLTGYGRYPEPHEAAHVAAALAERDRLSGECARARQLRDEALAECDRIRREIW